ncbi:hypothetical protein AVEN_149295-1 [Araneus ventricosus]|uniref:Uncharacterized protein n=1 Tax=Araneus ventricosus TaxID=182803 RepID=A0A4Y2T1H2_ARAVE|nr:hypothetical protein AVEN_149295-1 [Araneus ventricosus]
MSGLCVWTLHRKKRLCEGHKTTCYFVCFRKDAGISLEKKSYLSLSFTYTDPGGPYQLMFKEPTCHRASWQPVQSASACHVEDLQPGTEPRIWNSSFGVEGPLRPVRSVNLPSLRV